MSTKVPTNTPLFCGSLNVREAWKFCKTNTKALTSVKTFLLKRFFLFQEELKNISFLTSVLNNTHFVIVHSTSFTFWIQIYWKYHQSPCIVSKTVDFIKENNAKFIKSHENWYIWKVCCKLSWEDLHRKKIWIFSVLFIWYWGFSVYFTSVCVYNGFVDIRLDSNKICKSLGKNAQLASYF